MVDEVVSDGIEIDRPADTLGNEASSAQARELSSGSAKIRCKLSTAKVTCVEGLQLT